ncbi:TIGR00341 family protein [Cellulomonas rhizosphaerae]|uniref:TIGR00341 family protein n=1 Tax=Cellulomonas rhizosphaerae TaxID=2293719 RepID=A0A413RNX0_9CELL|nr:TIGR00341 family protein [Cellulomonas rhizosphaerae]RHA43716.1 TIGR00341 family protein [Cellulomonas rhizosphaerae]
MALNLIRTVLPDSQRRTADNLTADLDLWAGDVSAKRSAFWIMLALSAVIATAGVLSDSTATVIGAMIIAPLATPIMGLALGLAKGSARSALRSAWFVLRGLVLVVAVGAVFSLVLPTSFDLLTNSQIASRTSPGLLDLVAAVATGFAGAIALARRDVAAVLPGVAIAISLVPPLAVAGVCLGDGSPSLAAGALLLFLSNMVALVLAGTLVFATTGYGVPTAVSEGRSRRRTYVTLTIVLAIVAVPLASNTVFTYVVALRTERVERATTSWLEDVPGATVTDVSYSGAILEIDVRTPGPLPDTAPLMDALEDPVPDGTPVIIVTSLGDRLEAGTIGAP